MRIYLQVLIMAFAISVAMANSSEYVSLNTNVTDGGISLHITNEFLKTIKTQVIEALIEAFQPQGVQFGETYNLSLFNFTYNVSDLTMYAFSMNYDASVIKFNKDEPHIHMEFIDFEMDLQFNYSLRAAPAFYIDEGPGQVIFKFTNITIGMDIKANENGVYQIETKNVEAVYEGSQTRFTGGGDISYALNMISSTLNSSLISNASNTIKAIINQALPLINGQISKYGCTANYTGMLINWCAMGQPRFDSNSVALIFKGEVRYDNEVPIPFEEQRKVPYVVDPLGKAIQISVSDYLLNTTVYSAFKLGLIDFEVTELGEDQPLIAETFKYLWPDITKKMNPKQKIAIRARANSSQTPFLQIVDGVTTAYGLLDISFSQINGDKRDVFLEITAKTNVTIDLEIQDNFKFTTNIKQFKIKAQDIRIDIFSLTNLDDLNSMIGTISGFLRNYLNRELSGFREHVVDLGFLKIDFKDTLLNERERYIYFDSRPQFYTNKESNRPIKREVRKIEHKPATFQDKVDAMANIFKITPIYKGIQELQKHEKLFQSLSVINTGGLPRTYIDESESNSYPKEAEDAQSEIM